MIRKIIKIEFPGCGTEYFHERQAWVFLEGSSHIPDYAVSARDLEKMAFGC